MAPTPLLHCLVTLALCIVANMGIITDETPPPHRRLFSDILQGYDRDVRPVRNNSYPVVVQMRINLYQLLDVNEPNQNLRIYVWVTQYWKDEFLGWDPKEYGGIKRIIIPYDRVWIPDTYLYNNLEMTREASERWISVIYDTDNTTGSYASATFQYPAIFTFVCQMNILYFPFDKQKCRMTIGSWTNDKAGIDYYPYRDKVTFESFVPNEEWNILDTNWSREDFYYDCCPVPYPVLYVDYVIQRKPLYYIVNLVVPTSIITLIAVVGFFTPATTTGDRQEKVNLGITTLLAMSIQLLMVSDQMPTTSDFVPIVGWFFLTIILIISTGTALTSVIIVLHQNGLRGKRLPKYLRIPFFNCLGKVMFMTMPLRLKRMYKQKEREKSEGQKEKENEQLIPTMDEVNYSPKTLPEQWSGSGWKNGAQTSNRFLNPISANTDFLFPSKPLTDILHDLNHIKMALCGFEEESIAKLEWGYFTDILDRLLLFIFSSAVGLVTMAMLMAGGLTDQQIF